MSALDTPVHRAHRERFNGSRKGVVVDIGGGDGRARRCHVVVAERP